MEKCSEPQDQFQQLLKNPTSDLFAQWECFTYHTLSVRQVLNGQS